MINKGLKTKSKKISNRRGGFTLVEAMFAIFILTFVTVGLMTVVSSSLYSARYAKQEIIMNFLIQEALDSIRNDRDNEVFLEDDESWDVFVDKYKNSCPVGKGCYLDIGIDGDPTIKICSNDETCGKIYLDDEGDIPYSHQENVGEYTYMRRYIVAKKVPQNLDSYTVVEGEEESIISANDTPELEIEVRVIWEPKNISLTKERSTKMTLLDWRQ